MNINPQTIDAIVQRVLRELRSSKEQPAPTPVQTAKATPHCLSLDDAVITVASLQDRLSGIQTIRVRNRAVVTPSVADLLREKKIELHRIESDASSQSNRSSVALAQFRQQPATAPAPAGFHTLISIKALVDWTCAKTKAGEKIILATDVPVAVQLILNRNHPLRAAFVRSRCELNEAIRQAAINVAVVGMAAIAAKQIDDLATTLQQSPESIPQPIQEFA